MSEFDKKISALTSGSDSQAADEYVIARGGSNYKITGANIAAAATKLGTIATGVWQGTAITDTYLATISTAGKVSNSATTATSANTASAIVARDASGNFSAGTITASLTGAVTGNASTATKLATARNINGVAFDGSADITVTAAAGTLSGSTLASGVTASSLTSVGTLSSLTVSGAITSTLTSGIVFGNTSGGTNATQLRLNNTGGDMRIGIESSAGNTIQAGTSAYAAVFGNQANYPTQFTTNGTVRATLDTSGNLGLGTATPNFSGGSAGSACLTISANATNRNGIIELNGTRTVDGNVSSYIRFFNNAAATPFVDIQALRGSSDTTGTLAIFTGGTERARITSDGNFVVGKTAADDTVVGMHVIGDTSSQKGAITSTLSGSTSGNTTMHVYSTGASAYRFYVNMAGTVYATNTTISAISDARYKENIRDLDVGLDAILALKPRTFDWKEGKGQDKKDVRGFIAQEFEEVFPDLVDEWKDEAPEGEEPYRSVRQDLIPVLVKAIQELDAKNKALEARLEALEA